VSREQESLSERDAVYCFGALLGALDDPLRLRPVAEKLGSLPARDLQKSWVGERQRSYFSNPVAAGQAARLFKSGVHARRNGSLKH
jgi:hypothetical protein